MTTPPPQPAPAPSRPPFNGEVIWKGDRVYKLGEEIGRGYFGKVFHCTDRWSNDLVAKVLVPQTDSYDQVRAQWTQELRSLMSLRHPNVTFAYDAFEYERAFYLILERCADDMNGLLRLPDFNGALWLPTLARDVLQALEFIHAMGYVHKDLHPGNVFVFAARDRMVSSKTPVYSFKVGDLGISRLESDINIFNTILAKWMLPPEAIDSAQFGVVGRSVDICHAGLLFLSVLLGRVRRSLRRRFSMVHRES